MSISENLNFPVYPNPTNGKIIIENFKKVTEVSVLVYNCIGGAVAYSTKILNTDFNEIDLSKLHAGLYLVKFMRHGIVLDRQLLIIK